MVPLSTWCQSSVSPDLPHFFNLFIIRTAVFKICESGGILPATSLKVGRNTLFVHSTSSIDANFSIFGKSWPISVESTHNASTFYLHIRNWIVYVVICLHPCSVELCCPARDFKFLEVWIFEDGFRNDFDVMLSL